MASPSISDSFLTWYRQLWTTDDGDGDAAADVDAAQRRLGILMPALLRAVYVGTSLRDSQMLHLSELEDLTMEEGVLVFARDQQASWSWGIPFSQLAEANPALVANPNGSWEDDDCSLDDFLRFFALMNRPYEPPLIAQSSYDQELLKGPWTLHEVKWKSLQHALWTNGEAVLEEEDSCLGARDEGALRRAAASLGIDEDEVEEALEDL